MACIRDTTAVTASTDRTIHPQILDRAGHSHAIHQTALALQAADGMSITVQRTGKALCVVRIVVFTKRFPRLAVQVDIRRQLAVDGSLAAVDRIGEPRQLRSGADLIDTALVLRGLGLGRAVPALTGIGQRHFDGVVFGGGKAAGHRDIVRHTDGIAICLALIDGILAVRRLDRTAHRMGQRNGSVLRLNVKGHLILCQGSERHVLIHVLVRDDDLARLGSITVLADGVGVVARLYRVHAATTAGYGFAVRIFQRDSCTGNFTGGDRQRVQWGNGEVFELHRILASIRRIGMLKFKRHSVACCHVYTEAFPSTAVVRSKQ